MSTRIVSSEFLANQRNEILRLRDYIEALKKKRGAPIFVEVFLKREFPQGSRSFDVLMPRPMISMRVAQSGTYRGISGHWVDIKLGPYVRLSEVRAFRYAASVQIKNHIDSTILMRHQRTLNL